MDSTPDLTSHARGVEAGPVARGSRLFAGGAGLALACLLLAGCVGGGAGAPDVVVHVVVEASCPRVESGVRDTPSLLVDDERALARSGCTQDGMDSLFTYDARMPTSPTVALALGGMRAVAVDTARASAAGEVTLRYAPDAGVFRPLTTSYGDGEDEPAEEPSTGGP